MKKAYTLGCVALLCAAMWQPVRAESDFNKRTHLAPDIRLKVNKQLAKRFVYPKLVQNAYASGSYLDMPGNGIGNQSIVSLGHVRQAPKEIIVVAEDIINITTCRGCRQ